MQGDVERFWIPIAQILPVFILGLVVEARVAFAPPNRRGRKKDRADLSASARTATSVAPDSKVAQVIQAGDRVLGTLQTIAYLATYVLAMVLVVSGFIVSLAVMAGTGDGAGSKSSVLTAAIVGAVLTGILPISRILNAVVGRTVVDPLIEWTKSRFGRARHESKRQLHGKG